MPEDDRITLGDVLNQMYRPDNNGEQCETSDDEVVEESHYEVREYPETDIGIDMNENLFIEVAVPGFSNDSITVQRKGNRLRIKGEPIDEIIIQEYFQQNIKYDVFERVIVMDDKYREGSVIASVENGILTIMIQPTEPRRDVQNIEVH